MQIDIQARNFSLTDALRGHIKRRLSFALSTRDQHILRVLVRLSDINGPRGGEDKCCLIQVVLPHLPDVVIENTEEDLYAAIDRAADRAGRTVGRRLTRQRDMDRSSRQGEMMSAAGLFEAESAEAERPETHQQTIQHDYINNKHQTW